MDKEKLSERLESLFKEEVWGRMNPKDIGISRFKILEDFFNNLVSENIVKEAVEECSAHLETNPESVTARYVMGLIAYNNNITDDKIYLKQLIDLFLKFSKWAVVEHLAEKILEYGENRHALKALGTSLEMLKRQKEAIPVWEELIKLDRFDAEVAKRLSMAIKEEFPDKSTQYLKIAIEGFIKAGRFDEIESLWNKLLDLAWDDIAYFERIERQMVDAQQTTYIPVLLKKLYEVYEDENYDIAIGILKRILNYNPGDSEIRRKLIKAYEKKYSEHSQYEQFMKISGLEKFESPVSKAIESFENNIVFDKDNYVYHRSWKLGQIQSIDSNSIIIDFEDKKDHKMSVQMALNSLQPVGKDHLYVLQHLEKDRMKEMFTSDFINFFKILLKSYGDTITVANIKNDLIPDYVEQKNWSKWWSKTRSIIKKDPDLGFSDTQKDLIFLRDKPVSYSDELIARFRKAKSFSEKLNVAEEFINNVDVKQGVDKIEEFISYFSKSLKGDSNTKLILSYFAISGFVKYDKEVEKEVVKIKEGVIDFIKKSNELTIISQKISAYDNKKEFLNLICELRDDWKSVYSEILFELPVRIHKYIITRFIQDKSYNEINEFVDKIINNSREYPEIFLYVFKNIMGKNWDYEWLEFSANNLVLSFFRIFRGIKKTEHKGNKLKNIVTDILFSNNDEMVRNLVSEYEEAFLNKLYDMAQSSDLFEEIYLEKFVNIIKEKFTNYVPREVKIAEENLDIESIHVLESGYKKKAEELNNMINVDMVNLQKELSNASDVTGDVRENVDYSALLEKQSVLKKSIETLDKEIKSANIIDLNKVKTDCVSIGTTVKLTDEDGKDEFVFTILGPWDADYQNNILSYRSSLANKLLNKKVEDEVLLKLQELEKTYKILEITVYKV